MSWKEIVSDILEVPSCDGMEKSVVMFARGSSTMRPTVGSLISTKTEVT